MGSGGDLSEIRGIIVVITFLSLTVLLIGMMPGEFVYSTQNRQVTVPADYDSTEVMALAESQNFTLGLHCDTDFTLGGHDFTFWDNAFGPVPGDGIQFEHMWTEYWVIHYRHPMDWYDHQNIRRDSGEYSSIPMSKQMKFSTIDTIGVNETWKVQCEHVTVMVMFGFNTTLYSNCTQAYQNSALGMWVGINFDEVNTTFNAWNLISMILFFQMPDVHPLINGIIAIPIWITIAYLVFTLITKLIPFT